jgi:hypothetical protein
MLYRALNRRLHNWFSPNSYAYRDSGFSLDRCQSQIASVVRSAPGIIYLIKRDISDYFASVNHDILVSQLAHLIDPADYLFQLLAQRIRFRYQQEDQLHIAEVGIPFGSAIACLFANIYLTGMDRLIEMIPSVSYFRYADDILLLAPSHELALTARQTLESSLAELKLGMKASHSQDFALSAAPASGPVQRPDLHVRRRVSPSRSPLSRRWHCGALARQAAQDPEPVSLHFPAGPPSLEENC